MVDYTFESLNDKEFELLVRDLLQKRYHIQFENFKSGRDQGIDLRHAKSPNKHIIVQCKHWLKTGITQLKSHLKKNEFAKVKKINPERYIFVTSLGLSPKDKKDIKELFEPYITIESDIIGRETLNNLLSLFPEIEERHYKLWLSSTTVLRNITTEYIRERSKFYIQDIKEKLKKFVPTNNFFKAEEILTKYKVLIITGEPGIGKTTLADFLVFKYLSKGYRLTYIFNDLTDIEKVFDGDKKQIFYFDDFLGSNYLEILTDKNFDSQFYRLIKRIKRSHNHHLIVTSRTTIYNVAKFKSEFLDNRLIDTLNYLIELSKYTDKERANILYNHIFYSELDDKYKNTITSNDFFLEIIYHTNFNPRIIEFITESAVLELTKPRDYSKFILEALDNPLKIWGKAFQEEISDIDKLFLLTLFSFNLPVKETKFKKAFDARILFEVKLNGFKKPINYYQKSLETLLDGFVKRYSSNLTTEHEFYLEFINPSVVDFLTNYLIERKTEIIRIIKSAIYYEQLETRFLRKNSALSERLVFNDVQQEIFSLIKILDCSDLPESIYNLTNFYSKNIIEQNIEKLVPLFLKCENQGSSILIKLLNKYYKYPRLKKKVNENIDTYLSHSKNSIHDLRDVYIFKEFLGQTEIEVSKYLKTNSYSILNNLQTYLSNKIRDINFYNITLTPLQYYFPKYYSWLLTWENQNHSSLFKLPESRFEKYDLHLEHEIDILLENNIATIKTRLNRLGLDSDVYFERNKERIKPDRKKMIEIFKKSYIWSIEPEGEIHYLKKFSNMNLSKNTPTGYPIKQSDREFIKDLFS